MLSVYQTTPVRLWCMCAPRWPIVDTSPLTRTEQATISTRFACAKHYFMLICNIKRACFIALDASINDALKVTDDPAIWGWRAGMCVINILDQLSKTYG
jgi:hypothetical protein